jgi:hypothetical protein
MTGTGTGTGDPTVERRRDGIDRMRGYRPPRSWAPRL